ncbi:MAG: hypothetical protein HKN10_12535, partial [Myxococcales bacterium]|nr:hypothetical protein [Myxococcales bacterium]
MKPTRPGIASADRPRRGPFSSLLDQILHDRTALDSLAFAYAELPAPERHGLVRAVLQDAADPTRALAALLAVEEEPRVRQRLAGLIQRHGRVAQAACLAGTAVDGEVRLLQSLPSLAPESLRVTWKGSKVEAVEIESPYGPLMGATAPAVSASAAVETLAPLLWQYIRAGGELPEGVE